MTDTADRLVRKAKRIAEVFVTLGEGSGCSALEIALAACILRNAMRDACPLIRAGTDAFEADQQEQADVRKASAEISRELARGTAS